MLIDTHCHLNFENFKNDYNEVIKRAFAKNIWMINVGSDIKNSENAIELAEKYNEGVYAAIGIHPADNKNDLINFDEKFLQKLADNDKVVAIGEIGLDYFHIKNPSETAKQKDIFKKQLKLAAEINKPVIIHCRDAYPDMLEILNEAKNKYSKLKGVNHFFSGNLENAKKLFEMDFLVSFTGVITFTEDYDEIIKKIPFDKIMVETDAPFVSPAPYRGKRNEPAYVEYVAEKIAEIRGVSFEEIAKITTANARKLFKI